MNGRRSMRGPRVTWLVYRKELLETLRDRRTLIVMLLLPLALYPLLAVGVTEWLTVQHTARRARQSRVAVTGPMWPSLRKRLDQDRRLRVAAGGDAAAVRGGKLDLLIRVPADYRQRLADYRQVELTLVYDETRDNSALAHERTSTVLRELTKSLLAERLRRHQLGPSFTEPLKFEGRSLATSEQRGGHLLAQVLPMLVVLMVLLGAFYPAIDLTAGEKERGTLETLLTAPVPRLALISGKFFVVATIATLTGLLNLGSIGLTFGLGFRPMLQSAGVTSAIPWGAVAMTLIALIPAAVFFAALMIAVAALARSFKEAQNLLTPVYMACLVPGILAQLPGVELSVWTALVPVVNVALLTRELIGGDVTAVEIVVALACTLAYAAGALALAARIYNSERLLFAHERPRAGRSRGRSGVSSDGRRMQVTRPTLEPLQASLLLLAVMAGLILIGRPIQAHHVGLGLLISEWVLIALPVVFLVRVNRLPVRTTLALSRPSMRALAGALLAGLTGWYIVGFLVERVQQRFLPMPPELVRQLNDMLFGGDRSLAFDLFAFAVTPAICEELLFRGALLGATRRVLGPVACVALNAALFGLFHLSVYRLIPTAVLGAVLASIALRSGSIVPAMLFHLLNNGATLIAGRVFGERSGTVGLPGILVWPVGAVFGVGLLLVRGAQHPALDLVSTEDGRANRTGSGGRPSHTADHREDPRS